MELVLNLAWTLVTAVMLLLWLRFGPRKGCSRRAQIVALAVLVFILFPVISVSDDLQALQNPAEADCCVRRDHYEAPSVSVLPALLASVHPIPAQPQPGVLHIAVAGDRPVLVEDDAALAAIDNRPPPSPEPSLLPFQI